MNQNKNLKANNSNKIWTILIGLAAITLYFNTQSVDPFNAPKLWVLILLTSILIGDLIVKKVQLAYLIKNLRILIIVLFFIVSLLISTIFTDQKYIAFFGDTQRKNGFIQYFCLTVILISTIINFGSEHIKRFTVQFSPLAI
jgi:hypothetical protein